jgi:hypothetical protein
MSLAPRMVRENTAAFSSIHWRTVSGSRPLRASPMTVARASGESASSSGRRFSAE